MLQTWRACALQTPKQHTRAFSTKYSPQVTIPKIIFTFRLQGACTPCLKHLMKLSSIAWCLSSLKQKNKTCQNLFLFRHIVSHHIIIKSVASDAIEGFLPQVNITALWTSIF